MCGRLVQAVVSLSWEWVKLYRLQKAGHHTRRTDWNVLRKQLAHDRLNKDDPAVENMAYTPWECVPWLEACSSVAEIICCGINMSQLITQGWQTSNMPKSTMTSNDSGVRKMLPCASLVCNDSRNWVYSTLALLTRDDLFDFLPILANAVMLAALTRSEEESAATMIGLKSCKMLPMRSDDCEVRQ